MDYSERMVQDTARKSVTHESDDEDSPAVLKKSKFEMENPGVDFSSGYILRRTHGLSPEQKSFLFKMSQNLLPTRERLVRVGKVETPDCLFCNEEDSATHFLSCTQGAEVLNPLMQCLIYQASGVNPHNLVLLNIATSQCNELPLMWLLSTCLIQVWSDRTAGRISRLGTCLSDLKARLLILKHTRWKYYTLHNSAVILEELLHQYFN